MFQPWLIAFGAGAASALLVASVASGNALALPLFYLAPLPILIAGLGWSHLVALVAASTAGVLIGVFFGMELLVAYVAGVGLPAYVLAYLALMARQTGPQGTIEWFPVGRILIAGALLGCLGVAALIPLVASDLAAYQDALRGLFQAMLTENGAPVTSDTDRLITLLVTVMPPAAAIITMVTQIANLWLAAHIARISGRLMRPWPDLAATELPRGTVALLAGAVLLATVTSGFIGLIAELLAATLVVALGFIGLAVIHWVTRGAAGRTLVISTVWIAALVLGWPFLALALLGMIETVFGIRRRFPRGARKGGSSGGGPPAANDG